MSQMPALARSDAATAPARAPRRPAAPVRPTARGSARASQRSHLRVVTAAPRPPRRMPFVVLCSVVLAAGLLVVLLLNLQLAKGTYALHDLQRQSTILAEENEALTERLAALQAPGVLAQRATELGMVPGSSPAFLRLPDGQVLGVPQAAAKAPEPAPEEGAGAAKSGSTKGRDSAATSDEKQTEKSREKAADASAATSAKATGQASARRQTPTNESTSGAPSSRTPTGQATR